MALKKDILGKRMLDLGTVYIASNKPENVFLIILNTEDPDINISVLYDRRFDVMMVNRDFMNIDEEHQHEDEERNIELTAEQKAQAISFIESYEE